MDAESEQIIRPAAKKHKRLLVDDDEDDEPTQLPSRERSPPSSPDTSGDDFEVEEAEDEDNEANSAEDAGKPAARRPALAAALGHGGRRKITWTHDELYQFLKAVEKYGPQRDRLDQKQAWARVLQQLNATHSLPAGITKAGQLSKKLANLLSAKHDAGRSPIKEPAFESFDSSTVPTGGPTAELVEKLNQAEANFARNQQRLRNEAEEMRRLLESFRFKPIGIVKEHMAGSRKRTKKLTATEREDEVIGTILQQRDDKKEHAMSRWERTQEAAEKGIVGRTLLSVGLSLLIISGSALGS